MLDVILDSPMRHMMQNLAMGVPILSNTARRYHRTGMVRAPDKVLPVFGELLRMTLEGCGGLRGKVLLELGPGQTPDILFGSLLYGAAASLGADVTPYLSDAVNRTAAYRTTEQWIAQAVIDGHLPRWDGLNLDRYAAKEVIPAEDLCIHRYDGVKLPFATGSVDVIWSKSALEHVRKPEALITEMWRVLRRGGVICHIIDLRDHYTLGTGKDWLRFLRYSDPVWELMASRRSAWANRLRAADWDALFFRPGFQLIIRDVDMQPLHPAFRRERLAPRFKRYSDKELSIAWYRGVYRKG